MLQKVTFMIKDLFIIEWKRSLRSSLWQRNVFLNIILGIFILYFVFVFLLLGLFLDRVIGEALEIEGVDVIKALGSWLVYYFVVDLLFRFLIQKMPEMSAKPFLLLPISRRKLSSVVLLQTVINFLNLFPLIILLPFFINVYSSFPGWSAFPWLVSVISMVVAVNLKTFLLKRWLVERTWLVAVAFGVLILVGIGDYFKLVPIRDFSSFIFALPIDYPVTALLFLMAPITLFYYNVKEMSSRLTLEGTSKKADKGISTEKFEGLRKYGKIGELILLEISLIFRNKRTKSVLYLMPLFLLYGFFFYPNPMYKESYGWLTFVGVFISGGFMMSYGQFLVAWEGSYFDAILTKNINFEEYFKAKYLILAIPTVISFILTTPYVLMGKHLFFINLATFIYNLGVTVYIYLLLAAYNTKKVELSQGHMMNYQGVGAKHFIIIIPVMGLPILVVAPFSLFGMHATGLIIIAALGVLGILFRSFILRKIAAFFIDRKYALAEGFRQPS